MHQRTTTSGHEGKPMPSAFTRFLWWLATANPRLIQHTPADGSKLAITGYTVLCTWLFATLSWTYFFTTLTNLYAAIALGLFMGFVILCIDRALIRSINGSNRYKILPLLLRAALAITIGMFMAQPALLYLFDKEIQTQVLQDNEARKKQKLTALTQLYKPQVQALQKEKQQIQQQLQNSLLQVTTARTAFLQETDGTGGSRQRGLATIAKTKQAAYEQLNMDYTRQQTLQQPALTRIDSSLAAIDNSIQQEQAAFNKSLQAGFLTRIEALQNLLHNHTALQYRYYLLVALILLIELMPVLAKLMLPATSYETFAAQTNASQQTIALQKLQQHTELTLQQMQSMHTHNRQVSDAFFEHSGKVAVQTLQQAFDKGMILQDETMQTNWQQLKQQLQLQHP
jgi:hypothetical protein